MSLRPISVRLIINESLNNAKSTELKSYFEGSNNSVYQDIDFRFFEIMRTQDAIQIPMVEKSRYLSALNIENACAVFFPIQSDFGYVGCFWACFQTADFSENTQELISNHYEWISDVLKYSLESAFGMQSVVQRYSEILDLVNLPSLIVVYPDMFTASNPAFETLIIRSDIINQLRSGADLTETLTTITDEFTLETKDLSFPHNRKGKLYLFHKDSASVPPAIISNDEADYYEMLLSQLAGKLELLETAGNLTPLQYNYRTALDTQIKRMDAMLKHQKKHYSEYLAEEEHAFEIVVVKDIITNVVQDLRPLARKKNLELDFAIEQISENAVSSGSAVGDSWLLTLSVFNMVQNAINFSNHDGKAIRIALSYDIDSWKLEVEDFGIGICPLDLQQIEEENKAPLSDLHEAHGLNLVRYTVFAHKGEMNVQSTFGKGTTVSIEIPYY